MTYSPDGYLVEVAYPDRTVEFSYDAAGNRIGMADSIGDSSWVYDWAGRAVADTDAQGNTTVREFDLAGNPARVEYADGRVTERTFDGRGLAVTQSDATGVTAFTYDADGGLSLVERASGVDTEVTRDLVGRVTGIVHSGEGVTGTPLPSGEVNPSSMAPGNAYGHCKDNGNGHPHQQPAGCDTGVLAFEYDYDERGLVEGREVVTDEATTATDYVHDALGRLTQSVTGEYVATYGWDAASNLISESVSEDLSTLKKNDGHTSTRSVNAINQLTQVVKDPHALPASHTLTKRFVYDGRGNRVSQTTTRGTGNSAKVESLVTYAYDGMDQVVGVRDAGKNLNKTSDDVVTLFERDGLGRALTVTEGAVTRERLFDGHLLVASGDTQLVRDPFGGVLAELDQVVQGNGRWATMVTRQQDVLTDVLGSTVAVAVDGVIDADLRLFGDFGEVLTEPDWDTVTGFTGKVDTAGLTEFVTRSFDTEARVWVSDDAYRGQVTRASSMNRYAYVEGAPESFVDHLGFFRAAAALEAQRLAAAEAAWLAAVDAWVRAQPLCGGYYGCAKSKTYEQQFRDAYAAASYASAKNAWSSTAVVNYNENLARTMWSQQALDSYAKNNESFAHTMWSQKAIDKATARWYEAKIHADVAQIHASTGYAPDDQYQDRGFFGNVGAAVTGWASQAWSTAVGIYDLSSASQYLTPDRHADAWGNLVGGFAQGVEDNGWWSQINMTINPVYHLIDAGYSVHTAQQTGDWDQYGRSLFDYHLASLETGALLLPVKALPKVPAKPTAVPKPVAVAPPVSAAAGPGEVLAGSGPVAGVLEASGRAQSLAALRNYYPKQAVEYVFDPQTQTFVVGRPKPHMELSGSPHEQLAHSIDADPTTVVGGTLTRRSDGVFVTTEQSGHFWRNWTPEVRQNFIDTMKGFGFDVSH